MRLRAERLGTLAPEAAGRRGDVAAGRRSRTSTTIAPDVLAIDSIQTVHDPDAPGAAGSVAQVRDGAQRLVRLAKERGVATVLVGHVTKDGALAGPRVLEHVVDTVLSFEGDRHHALRMLRALKHRFGATDELGLFEMTERRARRGRRLRARCSSPTGAPGAPGSVVAPVIEGTRPLLRRGAGARVADTPAPMPRRVAQALDSSRLAMLHRGAATARPDRRSATHDVYASVAGGVRVAEPGADLAVALAIASARRDDARRRPTRSCIGEVGLGGEVRQVPQAPRRLGRGGAARVHGARSCRRRRPTSRASSWCGSTTSAALDVVEAHGLT